MEKSNKKIILTVVGILLIIAIVGWLIFKARSVDDVQYNNTVQTAEQAFNSGNVDMSISELEEMLKKNLSDVNREDASIALASAYAQKGSLEFKETEYGNKAVSLLDVVIKNNPNISNAFRVRAYAYEIMQNYPAAIDDYINAIRLDQKNAMAYSGLGHAYSLMGDMEKALPNLQEAVKLDPTLDHALYNLARIYFNLRNTESAELYAKKVIDISKNNRFISEANGLLGLLKMSEYKYAEAIEFFQKAISVDAGLVHNYVFLADSKLNLSSSGDFMFQEDFEIKKSELLKEVSELLDKAISINENYAASYLVYGRVYFLKNSREDLIRVMEKGLSVVDKDITLGVDEKAAMKIRLSDMLHNYLNII